MRQATYAATALLVSSTPALAHLNPDQHGSFAAGLSHPLFGPDHILAMVAVGLWAALLGKQAVWALPTAFVGTMIVGFVLATAGYSLPMAEPVILLSVLVLGMAVALSLQLSVAMASTLIGLFALFHGFAHGAEVGDAHAVAFGSGFAVSTAVLHIMGLAIAVTASRYLTNTKLVQGLGLATTLAGLALAITG